MTIESLYREFLLSEGISTDTRKDIKGTLFFALRGDNFDGNLFVSDALEKGCRLAITERKELEGETGVVCVSSPLKVLQKMAHLHRMEVSPRVLAITGSNGKTTTKELVALVLSRNFSVLATSGNLNNHIGVPLTLLSINEEEVAVIEMGANHPGEIRQLSEIAAPDMGLITNIGKAHLEGFGNEEGVLKAKGELYEYLSGSGGNAIIDGRDPLLLKKAAETGVGTLVIAPHGQLPVSGRIVKQTPFLELELELDGTVYQLTTRLVGSYNLQNILLAAGVGFQFGIPAVSVIDAIGSYIPKNQRSQFVEGERNRVILDSYNANPSSMREAIKGVVSYATSPAMLILGDMAELGDASIEEHRKLVQWIETLPVDRVLMMGPLFSEVCEPSSGMDVFRERSELEAYLDSEKPEGYQILVKGSRVMELERLLPLIV
ncbi:MAG: UDP-N-acetylmuramoyl-tripeptide--D-alanyl-D-alanine ligase [Bacteroidota bacterium]